MADLKLIQKLGSGTKRKFSEVYLLENQKTNQQLVLKKLNKKTASSLQLEALRSEAEFSFEEACLPQVVALDEDEEQFGILLKYKEGITLDAFWKTLAKKQRIPFLVALIQQMGTVLNLLSEKGIVHGDLKPSNILIDGSADYFKVNLIDFGLAFRKGSLPNRSLVFSLAYSAPELILQRLALCDSRTDFYSLGIILYQLWADKLPITNANPGIMTNLQVNYPIENRDGLPKDLFSIVKALCQKEALTKPVQYLQETEVVETLKKGMNKRPSQLSELDLKPLLERKRTFIRNLVKIFSNS